MAAPINTNRYRLLLLLYLTFLCLSILSVPASLLESNLYVTRTINYQEELIKKQAARSEVLLKEVNQRLLDTLPKLRNYLFLEKEINRSYLLLDSIDQYLLSSLNDMGTSIDKEYAKRKTVSGLLTKNSLINKIEDTLFLLAKKINQFDTALGAEYSRWLPDKRIITTRNNKKINWANFFFIDKPASVAYMQFKRIKLLLLQTRVDVVEQRNTLITQALMADQKRLAELLKTQTTQSILDNVSLTTQVKDAQSDALLKQQQLELLSNVRLDLYYVGVSHPLISDLTSVNIDEVDIEFSPSAKTTRNSGKINVLFASPGQYQLKMYLRQQGEKRLLISRSVSVQRLPDPDISLPLNTAGRNTVSASDLLKMNNLTASFPVSGIGPVAMRINGFRITMLGTKTDIPSVYNYGPVFQDASKELFAKLKKGDLILFDNITVVLGDGSTRTVKPVLFKIAE